MNDPFLIIKKVYKTYFDKKKPPKEALKNVSLDLARGEIFSLLGVNGAGKTTLVSILATLHPPTSGDIFWNNQSIFQQLLKYRAIVGYCPQYSTIEPELSMEENLVFAGMCYGLSKAKSREHKDSLIDQFHLQSYAQAHFNQLSGGYKQRFLIARALVHKPQLVVLDEPTVGLDSHIRRELWEVIASLREQKITVLLTTHYLDEAEALSSRICLIHGGTIRTVDTPENLKKKHKKANLEEVFLTFVNDPDAELFNSEGSS